MNIAIMYCRKLINKCSGTGCFDAYNECKDKFEEFEYNKPTLSSFFTCSGCKETLLDGEDWEHKINQLNKKNVERIYMATCIGIECKELEKQEKMLSKEGFDVIWGTHK